MSPSYGIRQIRFSECSNQRASGIFLEQKCHSDTDKYGLIGTVLPLRGKEVHAVNIGFFNGKSRRDLWHDGCMG
ncbi:MAG TPA: hypothetical protein VGY98_06140, partial [Verrucomicrobiae bacterium]|nr:hypothetical protein [Verrucomicrobiae bacterium]